MAIARPERQAADQTDMLATLGCERADSTQQPPQQHNQANHKPQPQGQLAKLQGQ